MSSPRDVEFCPSRANLDWSQIQCADASSIQVAAYDEVKYFQPPPSDSEDGNGDDHEVEADGDGKCERCCQMWKAEG